jgi:predicted phage-related endonuclease
VDAVEKSSPDDQPANAATLKAMEAHARSCGMNAAQAEEFTQATLDREDVSEMTVGECKQVAEAMTEFHTSEQQELVA